MRVNSIVEIDPPSIHRNQVLGKLGAPSASVEFGLDGQLQLMVYPIAMFFIEDSHE